MSQLPSHVSVKTLSPAIEIGIKNSFSCLNRVPNKFQPHVYHNAACIDGYHISLVPLPLEVPGPRSKSSKTREKVLIRMHMYAIK